MDPDDNVTNDPATTASEPPFNADYLGDEGPTSDEVAGAIRGDDAPPASAPAAEKRKPTAAEKKAKKAESLKKAREARAAKRAERKGAGAAGPSSGADAPPAGAQAGGAKGGGDDAQTPEEKAAQRSADRRARRMRMAEVGPMHAAVHGLVTVPVLVRIVQRYAGVDLAAVPCQAEVIGPKGEPVTLTTFAQAVPDPTAKDGVRVVLAPMNGAVALSHILGQLTAYAAPATVSDHPLGPALMTAAGLAMAVLAGPAPANADAPPAAPAADSRITVAVAS